MSTNNGPAVSAAAHARNGETNQAIEDLARAIQDLQRDVAYALQQLEREIKRQR